MDAPLHKADLKTYIFQAMHENINMFSSAFLFQKFSMVFLIFEMLYNQKQANINHHVFYLVTPHEIKSCNKQNS